MNDEERVQLRAARGWLLGEMQRWGVDERGHLIVAGPRVTRDERGARRQRERLGGCVGYYSAMSQYRSRIRIVVIVDNVRSGIERSATPEDAGARLAAQVERTLAHEYGHVMAEAIKVEAARGNVWNVPSWGSRFDDDEEEFAEDFARFLTGSADCDATFWEAFMPRYASEWLRTFAGPGPATQWE